MNRFFIAGYSTCGAFIQAHKALLGLQAIYPDLFEITVNEYPTKDEYLLALENIRKELSVENHKTSPIVWTGNNNENGSQTIKYIGGRDETIVWCKKYIQSISQPPTESTIDSIPLHIDDWNPNHGYTYDLIVIGGGSGGLACSKEAQKLGARIAVLDFVKPSPKGSKWGLGGTCVNVGCIPKKLMHNAALLGELIKDSRAYGWEFMTKSDKPPVSHSWEILRENVQDHIKGLNFGYRVQLREKGVTYLNKLGSFQNAHEIICTDAKGKTEVISAARFVIAVGGRPSPLDCPGAEHAITSDDLFSLSKAPGKTCVVGAGYVALECAGFITGLHQGDVTVLIRSIPLRGFDVDVVEYVVKAMEANGTNFITGVTPLSITKQSNGRLLVKYSNGNSDEFDTVLAAIGRYADTKGLNLDNATIPTDSNLNPSPPIKINPSNGKIVCNYEQTSIPHIYAIGDVIDSVPELTPAAILAGKLLARRLFRNTGYGIDYMNYKTIPTTVFTPLELGTVGMTEDEAISAYGIENIDCYVSAFAPLEWTLAAALSSEDNSSKDKISCYAKVVIDVTVSKANPKVSPKVLGLHIAAPNAGEIIQGYAVAYRKGNLTFDDLVKTVGIHPTIAEEFTVMNITKSSGEKVEKTSC